MISRRTPGARHRFTVLPSLPILLSVALALDALAQVVPEDDPAVPDSLRFETPAERAQAAPVAPTWSVELESGDFDLVFEDLPEDDLGVEEDYTAATKIWPYLHYNRVDAWAVGLDFGFSPQGGWFPEFDVRFAQVFNRDHRWLYAISIRQPILSERRLLLGLEARRFTDHFDQDRVATGENLVSSVFFKFDYRDYFDRRGVSYFVEARPWPTLDGRFSYDRHEYTSITGIAAGTWSVFRNSEPWRENPAIDEGREASVALDATWDTRGEDEAAEEGIRVRGTIEIASEDLGSEETFSRYTVEGSGRWSPRPNLFAKSRLLLGTTGAGSLPFQREYAIGGISTLRAHPYKSSRGDQVLLWNAEFAVRLLRGRERAGVRTDLRALLLLDLGQAWRSESFDLSKQAVLADAGVGLAFADERLALYVAQDLRNTKLDPVVSLRLSQPF